MILPRVNIFFMLRYIYDAKQFIYQCILHEDAGNSSQIVTHRAAFKWSVEDTLSIGGYQAVIQTD